jgi:biopolymer transport protein TolR
VGGYVGWTGGNGSPRPLTVIDERDLLMSMNVGGKKGSMSDINITPYIDILLVLLIIFMVITPVKQMDLDIKVPQTSDSSAKGAVDPNVIVLTYSERAEIAINNKPISIGKLHSELHDYYSKRSNKNMFISASVKANYGDVVRIIDIAKGAGVGDIGLLTEEDLR